MCGGVGYGSKCMALHKQLILGQPKFISSQLSLDLRVSVGKVAEQSVTV